MTWVKPKLGAILAGIYFLSITATIAISHFTATGEDPIAMGIIGLLTLPEELLIERIGFRVKSNTERVVLLWGCIVFNTAIIYFLGAAVQKIRDSDPTIRKRAAKRK
jgi:hypothetical protein